ncbi:MAG: hypothetical protein JWL90_4177, partial [Chthoniobacteraceae bacterium]|nr:hypothetical protein [Chthoniobacteraceae bacterium]
KCGVISNYALEAAAVDDVAASGVTYILVPVVNAGMDSKPVQGQKIISQMSRAILTWARAQSGSVKSAGTQ